MDCQRLDVLDVKKPSKESMFQRLSHYIAGDVKDGQIVLSLLAFEPDDQCRISYRKLPLELGASEFEDSYLLAQTQCEQFVVFTLTFKIGHNQHRPFTTIYVLNTETLSISAIELPNVPLRGHPSMCSMGESCILFSGGYSSEQDAPVSDTYIINVISGHTKQLQDLPQPLYKHTQISSEGSVYVFGGITTSTELSTDVYLLRDPLRATTGMSTSTSVIELVGLSWTQVSISVRQPVIDGAKIQKEASAHQSFSLLRNNHASLSVVFPETDASIRLPADDPQDLIISVGEKSPGRHLKLSVDGSNSHSRVFNKSTMRCDDEDHKPEFLTRRHSQSACVVLSRYILLFGGKTASTHCNDFLLYDTITSILYPIDLNESIVSTLGESVQKDNVPAPRYNALTVFDGLDSVLFALGRNDYSTFNDAYFIRIYDLLGTLKDKEFNQSLLHLCFEHYYSYSLAAKRYISDLLRTVSQQKKEIVSLATQLQAAQDSNNDYKGKNKQLRHVNARLRALLRKPGESITKLPTSDSNHEALHTQCKLLQEENEALRLAFADMQRINENASKASLLSIVDKQYLLEHISMNRDILDSVLLCDTPANASVRVTERMTYEHVPTGSTTGDNAIQITPPQLDNSPLEESPAPREAENADRALTQADLLIDGKHSTQESVDASVSTEALSTVDRSVGNSVDMYTGDKLEEELQGYIAKLSVSHKVPASEPASPAYNEAFITLTIQHALMLISFLADVPSVVNQMSEPRGIVDNETLNYSRDNVKRLCACIDECKAGISYVLGITAEESESQTTASSKELSTVQDDGELGCLVLDRKVSDLMCLIDTLKERHLPETGSPLAKSAQHDFNDAFGLASIYVETEDGKNAAHPLPSEKDGAPMRNLTAIGRLRSLVLPGHRCQSATQQRRSKPTMFSDFASPTLHATSQQSGASMRRSTGAPLLEDDNALLGPHGKVKLRYEPIKVSLFNEYAEETHTHRVSGGMVVLAATAAAAATIISSK